MRFGIISHTWANPFKTEDLHLLHTVKGLGFEAFELVLPEPDALDYAAAGRALKEAGLASALTARITAGRDLASGDPAVRERAVAYLKRCVDAAVAMGSPIVGGPIMGGPLVFVGRRPRPVDPGARRAKWRRCVEGLKAVADYAGSRGVRLAVEPVNRFESDLVNRAEQAVELVEAVGHPAVGVLLDTFHMNIEEDDIAGAIRATGRHLIHFHANENHRGIPGEGHLDWKAVLAALQEVGYGGYVVLEPFRRDDRSFGTPLAAWRPPDPGQEERIGRALRMLQGMVGGAGAGG